MAIYIVTGKLGGGKTLAAVSKINEALGQGRRVATNLDLTIENLPSCSRKTKHCDVLRVPDQPTVDHIKEIGFGIKGVKSLADARRHYDESKFGLLVLDECGTWLNSRDWQAEGRRDLINFLLHIRKHLWDVYLIIQDVALLDKQARKALAEHVVYCRRLDRMSIPVIGWFIGLFTGSRVKMPKIHLGIVKYGDQPQSITVDRWWYNGRALYDAYDTTQVFRHDLPEEENRVRKIQPPWYRYQHTFVKKWTWRKIMQLTRIYLRQWSRTVLLAAGIFAGATVTSIVHSDDETEYPAQTQTSEHGAMLGLAGSDVVAPDETEHVPFIYRLRIASIFDIGRGRRVKFTDGEREYSERALKAMGVGVSRVGNNRYRCELNGEVVIVGIFD